MYGSCSPSGMESRAAATLPSFRNMKISSKQMPSPNTLLIAAVIVNRAVLLVVAQNVFKL